jgi:D-apiose dehydrogenase
MTRLRLGVIGAGFWARSQLAGWRELPGVECVAVCDVDRSRAQALADTFGVPRVYDDGRALMAGERLDAVDVITSPGHHAAPVRLAAEHGLPVICQKPMAPTLAEADAMVAACRDAGAPFFVHENFRWQAPMRAVKGLLGQGAIGRPFRARIQFSCSFPVFDNQPSLKELDQFILADVGSHVLDLARFFFGEARTLSCHTARVRADIRGEDVATVFISTDQDVAVTCELSYASRLEHERFPETFMVVEADEGSLVLGPGCEVRVTTKDGTRVSVHAPRLYDWVDPAYAVVQSSIVECNRNLLAALRGEARAETDADDNLRTLRLVFAAYDSATRGEAVRFDAAGRATPGTAA